MTWHVLTTSAKIHALSHVALTLFAKSLTIILFALVNHRLLEILSPYAVVFNVSKEKTIFEPHNL